MNETTEIQVSSVEELPRAVEALLDFAGPRTLFAFEGEIGAGKTTFIQAFCRHFKVREKVTSPTFSLVNEYSYSDPDTGQEAHIYHLDLYRLKDLQEALDIGIEEILDSAGYCLIEWPQVIEALLPEDVVRIKLSIIDNSTRKILFL